MRPLCTLTVAICLAMAPAISYAEAPFTPAQYAEIQRLLEAQKIAIRAEVKAELLAEIAQQEEKAPAAVLSPVPAPPEAPPTDQAGRPPTGQIGFATADQDFAPGVHKVEFSASAGESDASLVFANSHVKSNDGLIVENGWKVAISAPIDDEDNGTANFGTLSKFANGLNVELAWTHASTKPIDMGGDAPSKDWQELCRLSGQEPNGCTLAKIDAASRGDGASEDFRHRYDAFQLAQYGWGHLYQLKIGASRDEFDYFDSDLAEQSTTKVGWTVGAALGLATPRRQALYSIGFDLERVYDEEDEVVFCTALYPTLCQSGRIGAPTSAYHRLAWVEARSAALATPFSIRVTHDIGEGETGVDLPIFLLHGEDGAFTGGIRFGWTSTDGGDVGVFVGKAFDVFD